MGCLACRARTLSELRMQKATQNETSRCVLAFWRAARRSSIASASCVIHCGTT